MHRKRLFSLVQPGFGVLSGHALDALFRVLGLGAAVGVEEELAAFRLEQALFVAGGIAELAENMLADELGSFGIVFNFANDLFHGCSLSFLSQRFCELICACLRTCFL